MKGGTKILHTSVLLNEIIDIFRPKSGEKYIDATVNGGGHAEAIAKRVGSKGKILGIDWDCGLLERIKNHGSVIKNIKFVCGNYCDIAKIAKENGFLKINGVLFDLGFSSYHIEESGRGFSFLKDEPLDMRYHGENSKFKNQNSKLCDDSKLSTAADLINNVSEKDLLEILTKYGEERFADRIARAIVHARKQKRIEKTFEFVEIIRAAVPSWYKHKKIHCATKTFQALRIAVNHELDNLLRALHDSLSVLGPGGRIAIISFHSLEDRIVKTFFKEQARNNCLALLTKKPLRASREEIRNNPRARSAKLRGAEILTI